FIQSEHALRAKILLKPLSNFRIAKVELKTFNNNPVHAVYFKSHRTSRDARNLLESNGIICWEADIRPHERYLMERFITAGAIIDDESSTKKNPFLNPRLAPAEYRPELKLLSLDIETSMTASELFSIGVWTAHDRKVFMVGAETPSTHSVTTVDIQYFDSQLSCLQNFLKWFSEYDPDVIIGWSVVQFDLWVLETLCKKLGINFAIGRADQSAHWRQEEGDGRRYIVIPGRVALDGIELLKAANFHYESYSLQYVSEAILGSGKLLHGSGRGEDIARLFAEDKQSLAEYNLRDCELVWDIFIQKKLLHFAVERSQLTGLLLDRVGGSVAAFEYSYLPRLHRRGYVAPNMGELESDVVSPGGYVMNSQPGIYDNILVLDFKSLYPSIIRTFLIDPCAFWIAEHEQLPEDAIVPGFNGAHFAREGHILPQMIENLSAARDVAKKQKNASKRILIILLRIDGIC
ncbi:MAG: DNA polymerase II, partial [Sphingobacteriales bacterium]